VLTVIVPVAESAKPHRIEVEGRDTKALTTGVPAKEPAAV